MRESEFTAKLMKIFIDAKAHAQRIETTTGSGIPDINVHYKTLEFWVEAKVLDGKHGPLLRPYQMAWITRRHKANGIVYIMALDPKLMNVHIWRSSKMDGVFDGKYWEISWPSMYAFGLPLRDPPDVIMDVLVTI